MNTEFLSTRSVYRALTIHFSAYRKISGDRRRSMTVRLRWSRAMSEVQSIDDDEIIDRLLTLVIGFARASKRWLINEREANTCADSFRPCARGKKMHKPVHIHIRLPFVRHRDLGAKFATRRRNEIREKSPIGGCPKLTVLSDASLQIFLQPRVFLAARYRYANSFVRSSNLTRFPRARQWSQVGSL